MRSKILVALIVVAFASGCSLGLRRDAKKIEASLLQLTPLGSTPEAVLQVVQKKGWRTSGYNPNSGYLNQERGYHGLDIVGVSHIQASLGDYYAFPLGTTNATAFWGFDESRRLIRVWVWKTTDTL